MTWALAGVGSDWPRHHIMAEAEYDYAAAEGEYYEEYAYEEAAAPEAEHYYEYEAEADPEAAVPAEEAKHEDAAAPATTDDGATVQWPPETPAELATTAKNLRKFLEILRKLDGDHHANVAHTLGHLACVLEDQGEVDEQVKVLREVLDIRKALRAQADAQGAKKAAPAAVGAEGEASAEGEAEAEAEAEAEEPAAAEAAEAEGEGGEGKEAEKVEGGSQRDVAQAMNNLALALWKQGKLDEAAPLWTEGLELWEAAAEADGGAGNANAPGTPGADASVMRAWAIGQGLLRAREPFPDLPPRQRTLEESGLDLSVDPKVRSIHSREASREGTRDAAWDGPVDHFPPPPGEGEGEQESEEDLLANLASMMAGGTAAAGGDAEAAAGEAEAKA